MDEAARTSGPAVTDRKRGPKEIREDIEHTREELGETVEALAAKTDVKAHARARVQAARHDAARRLRTHPEIFGLVAAVAAGLFVRSLSGRGAA